MRIVLDTNVFISGIFFSGPPAQILRAWKNRRSQIVLSKEIPNELTKDSEFDEFQVVSDVFLIAWAMY